MKRLRARVRKNAKMYREMISIASTHTLFSNDPRNPKFHFCCTCVDKDVFMTAEGLDCFFGNRLVSVENDRVAEFDFKALSSIDLITTRTTYKTFDDVFFTSQGQNRLVFG